MEQKNLNKKIKIPDLKIEFLHDCLLINRKILVLTDLHIGYEEYIYKESLFQRTQLKEILEKLEKIFEFLEKQKIKLKKIIILGDLKHEFGEISDSEWRETLYLLDYLLNKIKKNKKSEIILIKGNHDNILETIVKKRQIKIKNYYKMNGILFLHGNKLFKNQIQNLKILIIGHLHPSITLTDKYKIEKFKCFLKGIWKNNLVYILPSFSQISFGYNLNELNNYKNKEYFTFINNNSLKNFNIIIYNDKENKEYDFGKLKHMLTKF